MVKNIGWNCSELMELYRALKNSVNELNNLLESMFNVPESIGEDDFDNICKHIDNSNEVAIKIKEFVRNNNVI